MRSRGIASRREGLHHAAPGSAQTLDRVLFRRAGQELKDFVSRSRLEILGRGDGEAAAIAN